MDNDTFGIIIGMAKLRVVNAQVKQYEQDCEDLAKVQLDEQDLKDIKKTAMTIRQSGCAVIKL